MIVKILVEGILLGALLVLGCAAGKRGGAVNMVFLYPSDVQERCVQNGWITRERIGRNRKTFFTVYVAVCAVFTVICAYWVNGVRGFLQGFLHMYGILEVENLIDRLLIDEWWVCHTDAWVIPGTEDMRPYIMPGDRRTKWIKGTLGVAVLCAVFSGIMALILK